jgi:23S rRNA (uracil1939-C5)-methyltransferase
MPDRPRSVPVRRGQVLDLRVETWGDGPDGLCRLDGYVVLVAEAVPGELVRVEVTSASRKYGRAELLEVVEASADRVEPGCPHFGTCGGCQLQHLAYPAQLRAKEDRLRRTLQHALRLPAAEVPLRPCVAPEQSYGQRNKLALHFAEIDGELQAGYFGRRSREFVGIEVCPVQEPLGLRVGLAARDALRAAGAPAWDPATGRGVLRAVVVRSSAATGQAHATLVFAGEVRPGRLTGVIEALRAAGAVGASITFNDGPPQRLLGEEFRPLFGLQTIDDEVAGRRYRASAGSFFQTSTFGAAALVGLVRRALAEAPADARVADLYCGSGLFALAIADLVERVYAIEDDDRAIEDAQASAAAAGIENVQFRAGRVEHLITNVARLREKPYAVILDPPRAGCDTVVLTRVADKLQPRRIVYVSCDPDSLGRDLARLAQHGYALREATPVDMFPHTAHVETVAVLDRVVRRRDPVKERLLARLRETPTPPA